MHGKRYDIKAPVLDPETLSPALRALAVRYDALPSDQTGVECWQALGCEVERDYARLASLIGIVPVYTDTPYPNADEMFRLLQDYNVLKVSNQNLAHPIWDANLNWMFRAVHDILGHWFARADFSLYGEQVAFQRHAQHLSPLARKALFVEVLGQAASAVLHGAFQPQKIGVL